MCMRTKGGELLVLRLFSCLLFWGLWAALRGTWGIYPPWACPTQRSPSCSLVGWPAGVAVPGPVAYGLSSFLAKTVKINVEKLGIEDRGTKGKLLTTTADLNIITS